jgi:hypothetical protein
MINQRLAPASLPPGERIYAIGDVHGCIDKLQDMHHLIVADLATRPVAHATVVHLGDYIDRGPDSAGVIEELLAPWPGDAPPRVVDLMGNHEDMMLSALAEKADPQFLEHWLRNGGGASLRSWGVAARGEPDAWWDGLPARHLAFLHGLSRKCRPISYGSGIRFCSRRRRPISSLFTATRRRRRPRFIPTESTPIPARSWAVHLPAWCWRPTDWPFYRRDKDVMLWVLQCRMTVAAAVPAGESGAQ